MATLQSMHNEQHNLCHIPVPRPSQHPFFDRLQYAKTNGEGVVHFVIWMTSISVHLGRQREGGVPDHKKKFCGLILLLLSKHWSFEHL